MKSYHNSKEAACLGEARKAPRMKHDWREISAIIILLATILSATNFTLMTAKADPIAELSVQVSSNVLRAGSNNTVTMQIQGIGDLLSNLDVSLNLSPPLVMFGDNHWRRNSFGPGDSLTVDMTIFAPVSAAGNSYQATVTGVYKQAGQTVYSQETHTVGFIVRGWIDLVIYDVEVSPFPVGPGTAVTVTGSLLNRGVISALFTNLTIQQEPSLTLSSDSVSYIGQLDPNAPAPFSVSALVNPSTSNGQYAITLIVQYQDDLHQNQQYQTTVTVDVSNEVTQTTTSTGPVGPVGMIMSYGLYLLALIILIIVILIVVRVRKRHRQGSA
jgi:uncharacterized membrane protein